MSWWSTLDRRTVLRSLRAALVVGTLLTALNQGDEILAGRLAGALWWKIPLTYLVPFLVATYGALGRDRGTTNQEPRLTVVQEEGS